MRPFPVSMALVVLLATLAPSAGATRSRPSWS